jgi:hypothetical protein
MVASKPRKPTRQDARIYVRALPEDRVIFEELAEALGIGEISATLRHVAREKHRELGLGGPKRKKS